MNDESLTFFFLFSFNIYWKLDSWEDDTRRRRRFVKNPKGTSHPEATLKASLDGQSLDAFNNKEELVKLNSYRERFKASSQASEQAHINEIELEQELTGPIHYTTKCKLICSICVVNGTLSVTTNELYFEVCDIWGGLATWCLFFLYFVEHVLGVGGQKGSKFKLYSFFFCIAQ